MAWDCQRRLPEGAGNGKVSRSYIPCVEKSMPGRGNSIGTGWVAQRVRKGAVGDGTLWVDRAAGTSASRSRRRGSGCCKKTGQQGRGGADRKLGRGLLESANLASGPPSHSQKPLNFHLLLWGFKNVEGGGTRLAQSVKHVTLDLWVLSSSPVLGLKPTLK